jgi:hypothetical protein
VSHQGEDKPGYRYDRRYQDRPPQADDDPDWWAAEAMMDAANSRVELQWRLVRCLSALVDLDDLKSVLAIGAGPLEELVRRGGDSAMDLIEPAAREDRILLTALAGVWTSDDPMRRRIDGYLGEQGQPRL